MDMVSLHHGVEIPVLGLGTWQLQGRECERVVSEALTAGYRHIDTALAYANHASVMAGIRASGVPRREIFITSKIWRDDLSAAGVRQQTERILDELGTDYVDLTLIHWPNSRFDIQETLEALDGQRLLGRTRAIGVSNFTIAHLRYALATGVGISVNQVELHPSLNQERLRRFCENNAVAVTAYSPLAQGKDLQLHPIRNLAEKYGVSPAQVVLNWLLSKGIIAIPRSANPESIRNNFHAGQWRLEPEDITAIDALDGHDRITDPPFAEFTEAE